MAVDHDALGGELFPILGQIIFALGQGADSLYISGEALSAGAARFSPLHSFLPIRTSGTPRR